ncbi:MAG: hypothetical protein PHY43_03950 [Verrucomicrobiales bacterium]|nr:hypothetical protein [Verrucomicrobiales bacterium]
MKLAIESDSKLSHGARTLGLRVGSYVYNDPHIWPLDSFPLPWTLCSHLCWGMSKRESYRNVRELVDRGHFAYEGIKGCPGKAHFRLILPELRDASHGTPRVASHGTPRVASHGTPRVASHGTPRVASHGTPRVASHGTPRVAKRATPRVAKKDAPLTNTVPTEEIPFRNERRNGALRAEKRGDFDGSLRSQERVVDGKSASPEKRKMTTEEIKRHWASAKSQLDLGSELIQQSGIAIRQKAKRGKAKTLLRRKK